MFLGGGMGVAMRRARTLAWICSGFTLLGLTYTVAMVGSGHLKHQEVPWGVALGVNLSSAYLWMLLFPVLVWATRRAGFEAAHWKRACAIHVPTYLVLALIHHIVWISAYWTWGSPAFIGTVPMTAMLRESLPWRLHDNLVVYGLQVLVLYVHHHAQRGEAERQARLEAEASLTISRLQTLRMQLQPHFLFNTLNALSGLVGEDPARAKTMIARLGHFLRLTLEDRQGADASLGEELVLLEAYLDIQRMRFHDRLTFKIEIAEGELEARVPHLLFQPLVENALQHGLARRPGPGTLTLRAQRLGDHLRVEVEDDGLGLPNPCPEGVGLRNIRARIRTRYGAAGELTLQPGTTGGVLARVDLPWESA
jgi:hypothetical protein